MQLVNYIFKVNSRGAIIDKLVKLCYILYIISVKKLIDLVIVSIVKKKYCFKLMVKFKFKCKFLFLKLNLFSKINYILHIIFNKCKIKFF